MVNLNDPKILNGKPALVIGIGIGVSGGNFDALKKFLAKMPAGLGFSFVIVPYMTIPDEKSSYAALLGQTAFPAVEAVDGILISSDRIYLIPPGKLLNIIGGKFALVEQKECTSLPMPIDHLFCSLAADRGKRAVGILFPETGSDGIMGLSEIKAKGGKTFIDDPGNRGLSESAVGAIAAGLIAVAPTESMAETVLKSVEQVLSRLQAIPAMAAESDTDLWEILDIVRKEVGHDFHCYKPSTIVRRIRRRMALARTSSLSDYRSFLSEYPEEIFLLQKDLLIGVTEFFRQPQAWEVLEEKVIGPLAEEARQGSEIRIWIPGCSTGKEVYSLAILLSEQMEKHGKDGRVQIFATDSDAAALAIGRTGCYSDDEIGKNVSPERLRRFFEKKDGCYKIIKDIRESIVFAPQNLTTDPPFSRLDLIICRNLLIYLEQRVQKKIIDVFHFALREGGFLFLGNVETIGDREDIFEPVSKKWRIYRRIGVGRRIGTEIPFRSPNESQMMEGKFSASAAFPRTSLAAAAQQMLLDRFAPACVMIDRKMKVLYVHGPVEQYLTFPSGELTNHVVDMAREGLRARLRGAIVKCSETARPAAAAARIRRGKHSVPVRVTVSPLRYPRETDGLLLIDFEDYHLTAKSRPKSPDENERRHMEDELKITREELQSTFEQIEISNNQLKASNEEVTAANEELQSANEELEISKEELQSLNEELSTINVRLQEKVEELEASNNDVVNLLSSTNIATVFLDKELKVRRYTPAITKLFSLIPSDRGRPIPDVLRRFSDETLLDDCRTVLAELISLSKEIQADDLRWYIRRITPYRTQDDRIEGVVITFTDVCDLKKTEESLRDAHARAAWLARFPQENPNPILRVSEEGNILYRNNAAMESPGWAIEKDKPLPAPLLPLIASAMREGREIKEDITLGGRHYLVAVVPFPAERYANIYGRDITDRKQAEASLEESEKRFRTLFETMSEGFAIHKIICDEKGVPRDYRFLDVNPAFEWMTGLKASEILGRTALEVLPQTEPFWIEHYGRVALTGEPDRFEQWSGALGKWYEVGAFQTDPGGFATVLLDITARKTAEENLRKTNRLLDAVLNHTHVLVACMDSEFNFLMVNRAYAAADQREPEFFPGKNLFGLYPHPENEAIFRRVVQTGEPYFASGKPFRYADHPERGVSYWNWSLIPIREALGEKLLVLLTLLDVTPQIKAEQALRRNEYRFRLLSETAGRLLASDAPQRIIQELCEKIMVHLECQMFFNFLVDEKSGRLHLNACSGIPEKEALKIEWLDFGVAVCGCAAQEGSCIVAEDILNASDARTELVKSYGIQAYACHPLIVQGRIIGTLSFGTVARKRFLPDEIDLMRTVSDQVATAMERKSLFQALQDSRDELELRVRERTAELEKLYERQKTYTQMLEQSNRELGDFVHVASHDLQEPLRKIQTFANRLVTRSSALLDERVRDDLERMQQAAWRMQALVLDLLKYSRVTSGPPVFKQFNLRQAVDEAVSDLIVLFEEKEGNIEISELPEIEADRVQMHQLFQNLIGNSLKYRGDQKPVIKISGTEIQNDFWEIRVEDNGIGFDERYADKIFKPFQRLHGKKSPYQGTGIGLAICRKIVERHGGIITASSKPGKGSIFYVMLPKKQFKRKKDVA